MPVIKVRENESFDVALRRFKRSCEKFVLVNSTKNQRQFVNVKMPLAQNVTQNALLVKTHVIHVYTNNRILTRVIKTVNLPRLTVLFSLNLIS